MQLVSTNSLTVSKVSDFDPIRFPLFSKTNALLMTEIRALILETLFLLTGWTKTIADCDTHYPCFVTVNKDIGINEILGKKGHNSVTLWPGLTIMMLSTSTFQFRWLENGEWSLRHNMSPAVTHHPTVWWLQYTPP